MQKRDSEGDLLSPKGDLVSPKPSEVEDPDDLAKETSDLPRPGVMEIFRISRPEWPWLLVAVLLTLVSGSCDLLKVAVYASAFDSVVQSRNSVED